MIEGSCGFKSMSMEKLSGELIGDRSCQNLGGSWSEGMIISGGFYSFRSYLNGDRVRGSTPNRSNKANSIYIIDPFYFIGQLVNIVGSTIFIKF